MSHEHRVEPRDGVRADDPHRVVDVDAETTRCCWCNGLIEPVRRDQGATWRGTATGPDSARVGSVVYVNLMGGWLCSAAPADMIERHHRPFAGTGD